MFELNFRDERYLPFEAAGVISDWSLELFNDFNGAEGDFGRPLRQFDYNTITDVIVHVRYTAREDAGTFKDEAIKHLRYYYGADNIELVQKADFGNLHHGSKDTSGESIELDFAGSHDWSLQLKHSGPDLIEPDEVTDLVLIVGYEWE